MSSIISKNEARISFLTGEGKVDWEKVYERFESLKSIKESLANKYFTKETIVFASTLSQPEQQRLLDVMMSSLCNEDASVGVYAMSPDDYVVFAPYLEELIREYHNISGDTKQEHDWAIPVGEYILSNIHPSLDKISMRARVARNVKGQNLPSSMSKEERVSFEKFIEKVFNELPFEGTYFSLTPGHKNEISETDAIEMRNQHYLFNDMTEDNHLTSSGIASDWPYGRGIWLSADKLKMIWVGEEDHLRIISIIQGSDLGVVDQSLSDLLKAIETSGVIFAEHQIYGVVTTCPTNMGTGKRQSVLMEFPNLTENGTNEKRLKDRAKELGLQARGLSGEHSGMDSKGTSDISPLARFGVTEADVTKRLYDGLKILCQEELDAN